MFDVKNYIGDSVRMALRTTWSKAVHDICEKHNLKQYSTEDQARLVISEDYLEQHSKTNLEKFRKLTHEEQLQFARKEFGCIN